MKALVVVDYQVDFVNGALGFEGAELLEPIIIKKIEEKPQIDDSPLFGNFPIEKQKLVTEYVMNYMADILKGQIHRNGILQMNFIHLSVDSSNIHCAILLSSNVF